MEFDITIEIPQGNRNKYEIDHKSGRIRLDRLLFTAMSYPADYGYIEDTLSEDGDPLDALILLDEPTFPGCVIRARAIGVLKMVDEAGGDDKILCVPAGDPRQENLKDIADISDFTLKEMRHFFETYKALEPGKSIKEGPYWVGKSKANAIIKETFERAKAEGMTTARWAMPGYNTHETSAHRDEV